MKKAPRKRVEWNGMYFTPRGTHLARNNGWQTEAEHMAAIRSALRSASRFWKPAAAALEAASRPYTGTNKRIKKEYQCVMCLSWLVRAKVEINHIMPCGTLKCYEDVVQFLYNLFAEDVSAYEVVCKECHKGITAKQREDRKNE